MKIVLQYLLFSILFISVLPINAQETVVAGQVLSLIDKSPVPFANVFFKYTNKGTQCNNEGYFLLRNNGIETTLVISSIGYKKKEIKIKPGQSVGTEIYLDEENTLLQDVLVLPGVNPALELIKKARLFKPLNDVRNQVSFEATSIEQNLVLLNKLRQRNISKKMFEQFLSGNLATTDSSLVVPLYMSEIKNNLKNSVKQQLSKNIFSSPQVGERLIAQLVGEMEIKLNFYENAIAIFGKSMISPLSSVGNAYYNFYLSDSLQASTGKQYEIHFRTKNNKNLAFNGKMWLDSVSLALTRVEAELPKQANINFIHNLKIIQQFGLQGNNRWVPKTDEISLNMNYQLMTDSLHPKPELFIQSSTNYQISEIASLAPKAFAQSSYTQESLNDKLQNLSNTPLLRTAKFLVDVGLTGYIPVGKIDIGKIQQIMRINDIEGFRLTLPFRTNQFLWKNITVGGSVGYGFKSQTLKYSAMSQLRIAGDKRRIIGLSYMDDYRRIDYNYNNFLLTENPLISGDEDISSSIFAFASSKKLSRRTEYQFSFVNDWNNGIESAIYLRNNRIYAGAAMPMQFENVEFSSLLQQSVTLSTRFSFGERTYEDHLQRIYIANNKPVIYSVFEYGNYLFGERKGTYGKLSGSLKHKVKLSIGEFNYAADMGVIIGKVPYPLLNFAAGCETGGYSLFHFSKMNYMEFGADRYFNFHSELVLNGLIMNQIPVLKYLNLREMFSFNLAYGSLNQGNRTLLNYPNFMNPMSKPYNELGFGFTNIFRIFTLQAVWRLSGLNPGVDGWGLRGCLNLSF